MKGEIDSLKTEITELKKDSLPKKSQENNVLPNTKSG